MDPKLHLNMFSQEIDNNVTRDTNLKFDDPSEYTEVEYLSEELKIIKVQDLATQYNVNQRKLMWKVDLCVVPTFAVLYFLAFLNRSSFGLVVIDGILQSLDFTELQFCGAYAAFFVPYLVLQFFSNVLLKNIRPHFWISISVLLYGAISLASGYAKTSGGYITCQVFHGLFQGATDTAVFYIMAHYYERKESQRRFSAICSVSTLAGMAGSLINYSINKNLLGRNGLEPWRWLLIIEGSVTMGVAVLLFFVIPDFPEGARFFNDNETLFIVKKLEVYSGKSGYNLEYSKREIFKAVTDPMIYLPGLASFGIQYAYYGYSFYEPIFAKGLGFSVERLNAKTSYIYVCAFLWCIVNSFASDYFRNRFGFLLLNCLIAMAGLLFTYCKNEVEFPDHKKWAASFLIASGSYSAMPILLCWTTLNMCGHLRKSVAISLEISMGSLGGLIALFAFQNNDIFFHQGILTGFFFVLFSVLMSIAYLAVLHRENKKKRTSLYKDTFEQYSERKKIVLGDKSPNFDYMY